MDIEKINAFFDSPEGKESIDRYVEKLQKSREHRDRWANKMKSWLGDDIDSGVERLLAWYKSDKYRDREYRMGYQPREDLLWVLFNYSVIYGEEIQEDSEIYEDYGNSFTGGMFKIGSYAIQVMHGQGSVIAIDKIDEQFLEN
jgi:hypothetical protein